MFSLKLSSRQIKESIFIGAVLILFLAWGALLYVKGPGTIIGLIGVSNSYLVSFILGVLGGSSVFSSGAFFATIYSFVKSGLNPFLLGIIGGLGLGIGDSLFYFLGFQGRKITSPWLSKKVDALGNWLRARPPVLIFMFIFIYAALVPLPNDLLLVLIGLAKYPYKVAIFALLAGDLLFVILVGVIAKYGWFFF
jgi:hypothetical protein